jgi:8-oxo-dGTP diphosphatase
MIQVVCALIIHQNKILLAQRNEKQSNPLQWEFPGGKVEAHETFEEALIREIKEELSIDIIITKHLHSYTFQYPKLSLEMHAYLASTKNPEEIILNEHLQYKWVLHSEIATMNLSAADYPALEFYTRDYSE